MFLLDPATEPLAMTAPSRRHHPQDAPLRVLVGKERFSENHAWSEMPRFWPACLAGRTVIEVAGHGQLEARLIDGGPPVDVVVPLWSPLTGPAIRAASFGLVQQFGVGVENIDLDVAADDGVWVASMPGLNAVPVAEHAITLLLALPRRLPEAPSGLPARPMGSARRSLTSPARRRASSAPAPSARRSPVGSPPSTSPSPAYAAIPRRPRPAVYRR